MKKKATIVSVIIGILAVAAIIVFSAYRSSESYRKAKAAIQWDCSVTCTEESTSAKYVITYSDVKVLSKTGTLTIQNKNEKTNLHARARLRTLQNFEFFPQEPGRRIDSPRYCREVRSSSGIS